MSRLRSGMQRAVLAAGVLTLVAGCGAPVATSAPSSVSRTTSSVYAPPSASVTSSAATLTSSSEAKTSPSRVRAEVQHPVPTYTAPPGAPRPVPVYYFGSPTKGHVYITIDDGWSPQPQVLSLMKQDHLPVTTFLIVDAAREYPNFWKAFVADGGQIEDHTISHPDLSRVPYATAVAQWAGPVVDYPKWFGVPTPTLGRPPYGGLDRAVSQAAHQAGLKGLVMWSAVVGPKGVVTWNHRPLAPGDIILLHWTPELPTELDALLATIKADHLTVAPLSTGLPASVS